MNKVQSYATPDQVATAAARDVALAIREAIAARGVCSLAFSGGRSPLGMFFALAQETLPWHDTHVFQVDERVAPGGSTQRNWTALVDELLNHVDIPAANIHPMPVEADNLERAAAQYQDTLGAIGGHPPVLDIVHLGLGADGHTASLVPGDAVLDENNKEVALTGEYQGHRRMTLTLPCLKRARHLIWFITGSDKAPALARMLANDPGIPAGRICHDCQTVFTDVAKSDIYNGTGGPAILSVDVGGSHVKVMHSIHRERRAFESGPALTAEHMCRQVKTLTQDWDYARVSIGVPCPVRADSPLSDPPNLGPGWVGYDFTAAFGQPVRLLNDAAMQALGSYQGGKMLFLGLGTGLGSALIINGQVSPLELAHLPYRKKKTYEDYVGEHGLERLGKSRWSKHVKRVVALLSAALVPDEIVIGGGNVRLLDELPDGCRRGDNDNAFLGGFRLWSDLP